MNEIFHKVPYNFTLESHISRFEGGIFRLPKFQRGFVWSKDQALSFMDSLLSGYPVSSLIFAQLDKNSNEMFILDGQQRILSLIFLKHSVFPTDEGRIAIRKWFLDDPVWETLTAMFTDDKTFEKTSIKSYSMNLFHHCLPSVELLPHKNLTFDEYWLHIKECFKRLNIGGTSMSAEEIEMLLQ